MKKGNDQIKKIYAIGDEQFKFQARNSKPLKNQPNKLYKIILYYKRNEYLVAMKFIYQKLESFGSKNENTYIFTEPEKFGPVNKLKYGEANNIDEIEMTFEKDEEIYSIKGRCEANAIVYLSINTIYGQYVEFGQIGSKNNSFHWDFYYNLLLIDSFSIGWDDDKINFFMCTTVGIQSFNEEKKNLPLTDVNELPIQNTESIYQSEMIGVVNDETTFIDDLYNLDLFHQIRSGKAYLQSIAVYYEGNRITRIDTEYWNSLTNNKIGNSHIGNGYEQKNQKTYIILSGSDYINYFSASHGKNNARSICFKTAKGKAMNCVVGNEANKKE